LQSSSIVFSYLTPTLSAISSRGLPQVHNNHTL